jgi:8-oxo-dGTP pyrophosphatase MutT (NUDIX family)
MQLLLDRLMRAALTPLHKAMKLNWLVRRPRTFGVHALALTPGRKAILVKLRYARGWRLPGGGRNENEDKVEAVLRELREEIGMTSHGRVQLACELDEIADFKRDLASLLVVEDVAYSPKRWSLEIERVCEASLDALPDDLSPRAARWIAAIREAV